MQNFFQQMKAEDAQTAPDFEKLFQQAQEQRVAPKRQLALWKNLAIAASLLLMISVGAWQWQQYWASASAEQELALAWEADNSIMSWEAATDELLPTELKQEQTTFPQHSISKQELEVKPELVEAVLETTELDSSLYQYGAIADWESPTASLMPPDFMGFSF